jgi:hypothetical protein
VGVVRQRLIDLRPDSLSTVLRQDARHCVQAALDRRRPSDTAAEGLVAGECEEPRTLIVRLDEVLDLVDLEDIARNLVQDRRPLLEVRLRRRSLEPDAHRTVAANTPPPPESPVPLPT